jgi:methylenetetrahydrofolate reductase (NADPH)
MDKSQLIAALRRPGRPTVSVEFFPPKDEKAAVQMLATAKTLRPLGIDFASITYGAGGTSRTTTLAYGKELIQLGFPLIGHLTCVGHSQAELAAIIAQYDQAGFAGILALRGDPPKGQATFTPHPEGFRYAEELVRLIRRERPDRFAIGVAGFPELHPESVSAGSDIQFLAQKVLAGADFVTTQLFLDNEDYFRLVDRARAAGVTVPIIPGIMPVLSLKQAKSFCGFCRAKIPLALEEALLACGSDEEAQLRVGVAWAVQQVQGLLARGVPAYHVYILNRAESAVELFRTLQG